MSFPGMYLSKSIYRERPTPCLLTWKLWIRVLLLLGYMYPSDRLFFLGGKGVEKRLLETLGVDKINQRVVRLQHRTV